MDNRRRSNRVTGPPSILPAGELPAQLDEYSLEDRLDLEYLRQAAKPNFDPNVRYQDSFLKRLFNLAVNRLWVRLSLAFTAIAFLSVGSILLMMTFRTLSNDVPEKTIIDVLQRRDGTIELLAEYYREKGSWDNIGVFLNGLQSTYQIAPRYSTSFSFFDSDGKLLFDSHPTRYLQDSVVILDRTLSIWVNAEVVGRLRVVQTGMQGEDTPQSEFLAWLRDWWWLLGLSGATVGVVFGILVSRSLAAPFTQLSRAAQKIGARDWRSRVNARGTVEVVALAKAFNNMAEDLERGEMLRRNLVADVAHELRTPLTVLQGSLRALIDGVYPLETREIANLYDQTLVLRRLVTDLHELSLAESHALLLNIQPLNVAELIGRIVSTFEPVAEERQVEILIDIRPNLPVLRVDPPRITQVLNNLLDNALRHTPAGGTVTINAYRTATELCIGFSDTGQGIAPEHLPYLFERFYRVDRARARQTGGTGLGLAIVRAIVEAHAGRIEVESEGLGKGATFRIILPVLTRPVIPRMVAGRVVIV